MMAYHGFVVGYCSKCAAPVFALRLDSPTVNQSCLCKPFQYQMRADALDAAGETPRK